jgi:hypothetical protein
MKLLHFAPPVLALAICATWLGSQRSSIKALEEENARLLEEATPARASSVSGDDRTSGENGKARSGDWKKIVADLGVLEGRGQLPDMRSMKRLEQLVLEMDAPGIIAALGELDALELPDSSRGELQRMLLDALARKNPELACQHFIDKANNGRPAALTWPIKQAFEAWLKRDPGAANTWLDQQLAAGTLDGKSLDGKDPIRLQMQAASLYSLIASDPAAAMRRMSDIPPDQRTDMLMGSHYSVAEKDHEVFADLVRSSLPKEDHSKVLSSQLSLYGNQDDLKKVSSYLSRIDATKEERVACMKVATLTLFTLMPRERNVTRGDFDQFHQWAGSIEPDYAAEATGTALAVTLSSGKNVSFDELADIAADYHGSGAGDDIIVAFIEQSVANEDVSKAKAREVAMRIIDHERREELLEQLK